MNQCARIVQVAVVARPQSTNDFHGLGAFILMFEQLNR
jgi:hypothetical protein